MVREKRKDFITTEEYERILAEYVTSPRHLKLVMDIVLPISPLSTVNHIYRSFLWLLYSGLDADMTVRVTPSDLDFSEMRISVPHDYDGDIAQPLFRSSVQHEREYPIYAEAVADLRMACELRDFMEPGRGGSAERRCVRADGEIILRAKRRGECQSDEQRLLHTLKPAIQKAFDQTRRHYNMSGKKPPHWLPLHMTPKKVETSGKFFRAYMEERMGTLEWFDPHILQTYLAWRYSPEDF